MKILFLAAMLFGRGQIFAEHCSRIYPVIVSFRSICCGVPADKPVVDFVLSFKKKYHIRSVS